MPAMAKKNIKDKRKCKQCPWMTELFNRTMFKALASFYPVGKIQNSENRI